MAQNKQRTYGKLKEESQSYADEGIELSRLAVSDEERRILKKGLARGLTDSTVQGIRTEGTQIRFRLVSSTQVIPQLGVAGEAGVGWLRIDFDKTRINDPDFSDGIARLTTHELNHVERTRDGTVTVRTLGDVLISEGMAQLAETEAGHAPADYSVFRSQKDMDAFAAEVREHLDDVIIGRDNPGFGRWFFGRPMEDGTTLPMYGGYALGAVLVSNYCQQNNLNVSEATKLPATTIIDAWTSGKLSLTQSAPHAPLGRSARTNMTPNSTLHR